MTFARFVTFRGTLTVGGCVSAVSGVAYAFTSQSSFATFSAKSQPRPVCLCGPSGAGKSTLITRLQKDHPEKFGFSVSHTTRKPRTGEVDGKHYQFVSENEMRHEIEKGLFIEWASVHGNLYGTSVAAVKKVCDSGKMCILDIDVQGVRALKAKQNELELNPFYIFVIPPSMEELERRLRARGTESEESLGKRMKVASLEIAQAEICDFKVVNDDLDKAYSELIDILRKDL